MTTILPPTADPLGEALHLLRLTGTLYCRSELTAPWGIDVPALDGLMALVVVTAGEAVLELAGEPPRTLRPRGLTLLPHGTPHRVHSGPGARAVPLFDIPVERVSERYELLRHGGGGALTYTTCAGAVVTTVGAHGATATGCTTRGRYSTGRELSTIVPTTAPAAAPMIAPCAQRSPLCPPIRAPVTAPRTVVPPTAEGR